MICTECHQSPKAWETKRQFLEKHREHASPRWVRRWEKYLEKHGDEPWRRSP